MAYWYIKLLQCAHIRYSDLKGTSLQVQVRKMSFHLFTSVQRKFIVPGSSCGFNIFTIPYSSATCIAARKCSPLVMYQQTNEHHDLAPKPSAHPLLSMKWPQPIVNFWCQHESGVEWQCRWQERQPTRTPTSSQGTIRSIGLPL